MTEADRVFSTSRAVTPVWVAGNRGGADSLAAVPIRREAGTGIAVFATAQATDLPTVEANLDTILHPREIARLDGMRFERRRTSYLLGRVAAKRALAAYAGLDDPALIEVASGVFGQPVVKVASGSFCDVSIAHSGGAGIAAAFATEHPLGIDLEPCRDSSAQVMRSYLTPAELDTVARSGWEGAAGPTALWCAREALSKVLRCGLTTAPEILAVAAFDTQGETVATASFKNIMQYKCHLWRRSRFVFAVAMPGRSEFGCDPECIGALLDGIDAPQPGLDG